MSRDGGAQAALATLESGPAAAWLVGGALRDRLLGRETLDFDVAVQGDAAGVARAVAQATRSHAFQLSESFGAWRIVPHRRSRSTAARTEGGERDWQLDVLPLAGGSIEDDLALRDLTINALAQRLGSDELVDPFGGALDLRERRLRMVAEGAFERDPLRALRLVRLACELSFEVEPRTADRARRSASDLSRVSPERIFEELKRVICSPNPLLGLQLMEQLGLTEVLLPELWSLRGIEQSRYHHLDVYAHTLAVLEETIELERTPQRTLGPSWEAVNAYLSAPLANELTRWQALRLGALLHDIAKPQTRATSSPGRVTFMGHDLAGAELAGEMLVRLRASQRLREHVAGLARNHLRLGFLVHQMPLPRRAIYRYLRDCAPVGVDVTVLSVADRLATRGDRSEEAIGKHLQLAGQMLEEAMRWQEQPPQPPLRGDELAAALGVPPGPALGEILAELEEASFAREIGSREEAIEVAAQLLRDQSGPAGDR